MSNSREDDEPVSIETDAPEADWIEQHQPVADEDEGEFFASQVREDDEPVSIETDAPEADWIEQHQPVIEEADEDRLPTGDRAEDDVEAGDLEEEELAEEELAEEADRWGATDDDTDATDEPPVGPPRSIDETESTEGPRLGAPRASAGARGCNLVAALVHLVVRSGRDAARLLAGRNPRSPG